MVTPVNPSKLRKFLWDCSYDPQETEFLCQGFELGFDLGYRGPRDRRDLSDNIPFTVGNKTVMWGKMMDEVELRRFAGPFKFDELPFKERFIQSPIGLVPKAGNKTRLIFHLSYKFKNGNESINYWTLQELASVKYNDLDTAVRDSLELLKILRNSKSFNGIIFYSKSDLKSAFRILPLLRRFCCFLLMKAQHPITKIWYYFIEKCLPFGASISCAHFQHFSNALKTIV